MATWEIRTTDDLQMMAREMLSDYLRIRPVPVLKGTLKKLEQLHKNYFESETGPGGNKWAPNSAATIARKGHGDVLQATLKLMKALTQTGAPGALREVFDEGPNAGLTFGVDDNEIPYWKYHDTPGGNLPWRPHIGMVEPELEVIAKDLLNHQIEGMKNAA